VELWSFYQTIRLLLATTVRGVMVNIFKIVRLSHFYFVIVRGETIFIKQCPSAFQLLNARGDMAI
jgi:hypothetical protein